MDNKIHAHFSANTEAGRHPGFVTVRHSLEAVFTLSSGEVRSKQFNSSASCGKHESAVDACSLQAAMYLLLQVPPTRRTLVVHLNSGYQNAIVRNAWTWKKDGWIKTDGTAVKNQLYIARYLQAIAELAKIFGDVEMVFHK